MRLAVDISIEGPITPDVLEEIAREAANLIMEEGWGDGWVVDRVGRLPQPRWIVEE